MENIDRAASLDVVTGFLGAGKTTFIARYAAWLKKRGERFCVIENEFGRAGTDAQLLVGRGLRVREISGGCVCCTQKVVLNDLLDELSGEVDRIVLEPSGLFCGDDLLDVVQSPSCRARVGMWVCVLDPMTLPAMEEEDLSVLESECMQAGSVVISKRALADREDLSRAREWIKERLPEPPPALWDQDWDDLQDDLWFSALRKAGFVPRPHPRRLFDHTAMFQSVTLSAQSIHTEDSLRRAALEMTDGRAGQVLRVKGFAPSKEGALSVNAAPPLVHVAPAAGEANPMVNIIGRSLNRARLKALLNPA